VLREEIFVHFGFLECAAKNFMALDEDESDAIALAAVAAVKARCRDWWLSYL
jgi:hypothetical protein